MSFFSNARKRHLQLGRRGENLACKLLRAQHYDVLCRNFKVKSGEIDIVARKDAMLIFVEVKSRRHTALRRPSANLSLTQKRRIYRASQRYLREIGNPEVAFRFDLIELLLKRFSAVEIKHWEGHFTSRDLKDPKFKSFDYT
ncbi:MAG: YraN family protein [Victivallaceae bacterium]|jgi:putative endonuclease|nr:YraN family protein [Victivallaceae bacterium]MDD3702862.1 YraN family protein [Victivallaceae bacterium]MDD4317995.1 YraN family protein [Victivallaceae bacterium]MDD5663595.1 YraN family protein [Victivallaceae bacterium]NLK82630.1 YraN family protein [Lentisphaerota bacterium]